MICISVIIPFFYGNKYIHKLLYSIEQVVKNTDDIANYEIIIVNDSPSIIVEVPNSFLNVKVIANKKNMGIHVTKVNGLHYAKGEWILFLDQDDEIVVDGFKKQIELTANADVVVGNGIYKLRNVNKVVYKNKKVMEYLINKKRFIEIRNLIPSMGECLIKKDIIPKIWQEDLLENNGADDWYLWLLLFLQEMRFVNNEKIVYIHNDSEGENLSVNYAKMRISAHEMVKKLNRNKLLKDREIKTLEKAIDFKYYQDTKQMMKCGVEIFIEPFLNNFKYRLFLNYLNKN